METTTTASMEFYIDEETHYHQISEDNVLYRISLRNKSTDHIEDVTLFLESVRSLKTGGEMEPGMYMEMARLKVLSNLPLLIMHDRDVPPKTVYALLPGESLSADLVQYNASLGMFVLWHAKRRYNRRADGLIEEVQHPDPFVPAMDYKIAVTAKYWQEDSGKAETLRQVYEVGLDEKDKLYLKPE